MNKGAVLMKHWISNSFRKQEAEVNLWTWFSLTFGLEILRVASFPFP